MKLTLLANNVFPDKVGGHERYVRELAERLARDGHDVTLIAKRRDQGASETQRSSGGVEIVRHRMPSRRNPLFVVLYVAYAASASLRNARRRRQDSDLTNAFFCVGALPLALLRRRYVYTFHAPLWQEFLAERQGGYFLPPAVQGMARAAVRRAERLVVRRAAAVVVLSEFSRGQVSELDPASGAQAILIPGGIDGDAFAPGPAPPDGDGPLIFTARRLTERTGVDVLIRAMAVVASEHPGARCAIAGTGGLRDELETLIRSLGLGGQVTLLGEVSDAELIDWYRRADLVVMPTRSLEGFGLTTAEALACGTPVLGTSAGATPELLAGLDPALVVEPGDPDALALRIAELLGDEKRLARIATAARAHALPRWGWPAVAARYAEVYERVRRVRR